MTFNAREIAKFLADGHACADLIKDAFVEDMTEALEAAYAAGQEQMREKAAQCALRHAGWARISDTQIMAANLMQEIRSIALSTPEA